MSNASEIRIRIKSIQDTKKVTDAMYMISSVKMQTALRELAKTTPYFDALKGEIGELARFIPDIPNRYFRVAEAAREDHFRRGILLITSDKGLVGQYNQTAINEVEAYMSRHTDTMLFIIGEFGRQYFRSKGIKYVESFTYSAEFPTVWEADLICADLLELYDAGRLDQIDIIYTDYIVGKPDECKRNCLLPLDRSRFASAEEDRDTDFKEFVPDPNTVLEGVIPSYLTGFIYSSIVDSYCSEQHARMIAMNSASKNAEKMLKDLKTQYNHVRQAAITSEIIEVTAGARALAKKRNKDPEA